MRSVFSRTDLRWSRPENSNLNTRTADHRTTQDGALLLRAGVECLEWCWPTAPDVVKISLPRDVF
jgi:hypothetical protein